MYDESGAIDISLNVAFINESIVSAAARVHRDPATVTLLAATKGRSREEIQLAIDAGITCIGENYVAEAWRKFGQPENAIPTQVKRHCIGHVQQNKCKRASQLFDVIQTIASPKEVTSFAKLRQSKTSPLGVLIEVDFTDIATRSGCSPMEARALVELVQQQQGLNLLGLMTMAPQGDDVQSASVFSSCRALRDELAVQSGLHLPVLSMGMSDDYAVAIAQGATLIRIGTAIFGPRPTL